MDELYTTPSKMRPNQTLKWMHNQNIWYDPYRKLFWHGSAPKNRWFTYKRFASKLRKLNMGPEYVVAGMYWCIHYRSKIIKCDKQLTVKAESDIV